MIGSPTSSTTTMMVQAQIETRRSVMEETAELISLLLLLLLIELPGGHLGRQEADPAVRTVAERLLARRAAAAELDPLRALRLDRVPLVVHDPDLGHLLGGDEERTSLVDLDGDRHLRVCAGRRQPSESRSSRP